MNVPGVYILQSHKNGRYYVGSSDNHKERLVQHNLGKVKATQYLRPLVEKAFIACESMTIARQAELRLKSYKSRKVLEKVIKDLTFPWNYERD